MLPGYGSVAFCQNFLFVDLFYCCIFTAAQYKRLAPVVLCIGITYNWSIECKLSAIFIFMSKEFTGIFLRKEILQIETLSLSEKIVLAVIDNLSNGKTGCFASNSYIAKIVGLAPQRVANMMTDLRKKNAIKIDKVEGKNRIIKLNDITEYGNNITEYGNEVITEYGNNITEYGNDVTEYGKDDYRIREHIVNNIEKDIRVIVKDELTHEIPAEPTWIETAQLMTDYVKTEGAAQWKFMCQVTNYKGDPLPLFSNWAGKATPYELSRWKEMIPKLQNWMKNEVKSNPTMNIKKSGKSWGAI